MDGSNLIDLNDNKLLLKKNNISFKARIETISSEINLFTKFDNLIHSSSQNKGDSLLLSTLRTNLCKVA